MSQSPDSPQPPAKPRRWIWLWVVAALLLGVWLGSLGRSSSPASSSPATASAPATVVVTRTITVPTLVPAPPPPPPPGPKTTFGDGTYEVGVDVAAGSYSAPGGRNCYWERSKNSSGELGSVIANEWKPNKGQAILTAKNGEFLKVSDCGTWTPRG